MANILLDDLDKELERRGHRFARYADDCHKGQVRVRLAAKTLKRCKDKVRELTSRRKSLSMARRVEQLNQYLRGWLGYFALADARKTLEAMDQWIRRRLRACQWKQWKRTTARRRNLRHLGLPEEAINLVVGSRKGYWRIANTPQLNQAMGVAYWRNLGLLSLEHRYLELRSVS